MEVPYTLEAGHGGRMAYDFTNPNLIWNKQTMWGKQGVPRKRLGEYVSNLPSNGNCGKVS